MLVSNVLKFCHLYFDDWLSSAHFIGGLPLVARVDLVTGGTLGELETSGGCDVDG